VTWTSDRDGVIFTTGSFPGNLSYGTHIITATAEDNIGQTTQDQVTIRIISQAPFLSIHQPSTGDTLLEGDLSFSASTHDNDYNNGRVPNDLVAWSYRPLGNADWVPFATTGHIVSQAFTSGDYEVRVIAQDGFGGSSEAMVSFTVQPAIGQKPTVRIISPGQGFISIPAQGFDDATGRYFIDFVLDFELGGANEVQAFAAIVRDPDGSVDQQRIVWSTNRTDLHPDDNGVLGFGALLEVRLYMTGGFDADLTHRITATYTDDDGNVVEDTLVIEFTGILL
jgi:hypothetical protein